jgi:glutamyl-tRNA reductase
MDRPQSRRKATRDKPSAIDEATTLIGMTQAPPSDAGAAVHHATVVALVAHARWVPSARREAFARELYALPPSPGAIVVHTCHRVELYLAPGAFDGPWPDLPAGGQRLDDVEAARHLIAVSCGLDSAVIGEDQVLHQLRETIAGRHADSALDPVLDRLFQAALHAGRRAHTWFSGPPRSLADLALDRIAAVVGPLEGQAIVVAGAGRMGRLAALATSRRGARLVATNRSDERAAALAHELDAWSIPFGVDDVLPPIAGAVVALGGPWPLGPNDTERLVASRAVVADLSSPPAIADDLQARLGSRFISVDDLAAGPVSEPDDRLHRRLGALISETGRDYCRWLRSREAVPAIQAMADSAEERRREELDWLLHRLPDLTDDDRRLVEQMSHRLVAGILHAPLAALNADTSGELERAARDLFAL